MKSRFSKSKSILEAMSKARALCAVKRQNALNFDIDGKVYLGNKMEKISFNETSVSFMYGEEEIHVCFSDIFTARRLRSRKYKFYTGREMARKQLKDALKGAPAVKLDHAKKVTKKVQKSDEKKEKQVKKTKKQTKK